MFKFLIQSKNWYRIGNHEYSTNLRFFKEHQLGITQDGLKIIFYSLLEKDKVFLEVDMGDLPNLVQGADSNKCIADIHSRLLRGDYGDGTFID